MNKIAIITGASSGIGLATSKLLSQKGFTTIMISKTKTKLLSHDIKNSFKIPFDLSNTTEYTSLFNQIKAIEIEIGVKSSVLVNSCGIARDSLLLTSKIDIIKEQINTNLFSTILMSQFAIKSMLKNGGAIINISSIIGTQVGNGGQSLYGATKAGINGFTKSLAKEMGKKNIRVNSIAPGYITTEMTDAIDSNIRDNIPLGRFGDVDEVADLVWYLVNANYMTGQCIVLDGGLTC
jgi:NAD(P)-dependent dehydrogenase (short-subunit alcohol dehydrogenase family)